MAALEQLQEYTLLAIQQSQLSKCCPHQLASCAYFAVYKIL